MTDPDVIRVPSRASRLSVPAMAATIFAFACPAAADGIGLWHASCSPYLTAQGKGCRVTNYYKCPGLGEGIELRVSYDESGPVFEAITDRNLRWLKLFYPRSGYLEVLVAGEADPQEFSALVAKGRDHYDYWTISSKGQRLHYQGENFQTGETVVVDDVELQRVDFEARITDESGALVSTGSGQEFMSAELNRLFGGITHYEYASGKTTNGDRSPLAFVFPTEEGFGSTTATHECGDQTSALELELEPTENSHDQI